MLKATADLLLPTTIIGSLPRPSWFTENLGSETFLRRMMNSRYREQYIDTVSVHLRDQEVAGLDICTDGDAHYDEEVGGQSWTSYPLFQTPTAPTTKTPAPTTWTGSTAQIPNPP